MKSLYKVSAVLVLTVAVVFALAGPTASAATDPGLGSAASFSIIAQTAITGTGTISGNVGMNSSGASITALTPAMVAGTIYSTDGAAPSTAILSPTVQADLSTAYTSNIPGQGSNGTIVGALDGQTFTPGVYDQGAISLGSGTVHLNGPGIYIFRASTTLTSSGTVSLENGARACDVYWRVGSAASINGSQFVGTILAGTGVHIGANVTIDGRALAVGGDVTLLTDTISGPSCAAAATPTPAAGTAPAYINVVKVVVNDNGGTKTVYDFPLFINGVQVTSGSPGTYYPVTGTTYTVTETSDPNYTRTFSGDCNANGQFTLVPGDNKYCVVTNNDIGAPAAVPVVPPLIDLVKVPSPLALPAGPGPVTYTYTLRNVGTVPVTNVTLVGDTCSPINRISGDTNGDNKLDVTETWTYTCSTNLSATHTNIVTATGWANGISAVDVANATVIVGAPVVPPLIHVTKVPSPLTLGVGGGMVTYTNQVTNPGTVALSNVRLTDNTCSAVTYVSGDSNGDSMLQPGETWTYTCRVNVNRTTTNTVIASGDANGMTARDVAVATVVVATAGLPASGVAPIGNSLPWIVGLAALCTISAMFFVVRRVARAV